MAAVLERFNQGVIELRLYLRLLGSLEARALKLRFHTANSDQCFRILKASTFLLIYNVVEAGVRSAFDDLYEDIVAHGMTYPDVIQEIQQEWLGQAFRELTPESANKQTYVELTQRLLDQTRSAAILQMSARRLPISGNLDGDSIRLLCKRHRIVLRVHRNAFGGVALNTVKEKRNALAHGLVSFAECGRDYTVGDLERISSQAAMFIRGLIASVRGYKKDAEFRA